MSRSRRRERTGNCAEVGAVKMLDNLTVTTLMTGDGRIAGRNEPGDGKEARVGISQRR